MQQTFATSLFSFSTSGAEMQVTLPKNTMEKANGYLEKHQVLVWMQEILEGLAKEKPDSPWCYIAQKAQQHEEEEKAKQLPLLDKLMKLEAEQEERRRELANLLEQQGTRQNTPEEAERQHLMKENLLRLEELRFDQMILVEKQHELVPPEDPDPVDPPALPAEESTSSKEARPEQLVPFGEYYRRHILKDLPPRLYQAFETLPSVPSSSVLCREAAQAALEVCHPLKMRDEDGDSSVAVSAPSRGKRRGTTPSGASVGASARSSDSTAATVEGASSGRNSHPSVPKLVLPKRLQEASDSGRRPLDSRQRKTREALEKLTAVYSVPISRSCPSLFSGKRSSSGAPADKLPAEKLPAAEGVEKRPPRPPLPAPPKERLVNKATTEATRVRSEQALEKERTVAQRRPEAKLQPLSSHRKKAFGPSLKDELRVRDELGKLLSWKI